MQKRYDKAFKAYDIRAIYGEEIDKKFSYILWKAIWEYMIQNYWKDSKFLIWCDVREANIDIINHFLYWMKELGFENVSFAKFTNDCVNEKQYPYGVCSTSTLYYLWQGQFDLWVSITASHNTGEYVGMKFFDKNVELISTDDLKIMFDQYYFYGDYDIQLDTQKVELMMDVKDRYQNFLDLLINKWSELNKKHSFVINFSNGAGVSTEKEFFDMIKDTHNISYINDFPDGNFSAHESDTSHHENYSQLVDKVKELSSDFGIMFDGDVDRIWFVSPSGRVINCDIITAVIAKQVLKNKKWWKVIFDIMSSKVIEDVAKEYGWEWIRYKTGRFFINKYLNQIWATMAGEASGHYMFSEVGGYEMPLLALYYVLLELEENSNFDEMIDNFEKYHKTPIQSIKVKDKDLVLNKIKKYYSDYKQDYLDWVSVYWDDFWFNVRWSNTENKIRFAVEANTKEKMEKILEELKNIVN